MGFVPDNAVSIAAWMSRELKDALLLRGKGTRATSTSTLADDAGATTTRGTEENNNDDRGKGRGRGTPCVVWLHPLAVRKVH